MQTRPEERRRHPRVVLTRACKVFHHPTRRFLPARTLDVSVGGTLMTLDTPRPVHSGDRIDLVIDWTGGAILPAESMIAARVVRTHARTESHQTVGVEFETSLDLADAA